MNKKIIGKILIVDDERVNAEVMQDTLEDVNYKVSLVFSASEAKIQISKKEFDLILMDIWMPGIDGLTLLKQWRHEGFNTPVVIMSGHGDIKTAVDAIKLGAIDYLSKPFDNLLPTIRNIFSRLKQFDYGLYQTNYFQMPLKEARNAFEKSYFLHHLKTNNYNISKVALAAQLERTTLYRKLKDLDIEKK